MVDSYTRNAIAVGAAASITAAAALTWYNNSCARGPVHGSVTAAQSRQCESVRNPILPKSDAKSRQRLNSIPLPRKLFGDHNEECSEVMVLAENAMFWPIVEIIEFLVRFCKVVGNGHMRGK